MLDVSYWIQTFNFPNPYSSISSTSDITLVYKSEHFYKKRERFSDTPLYPDSKKHNVKLLNIYSKSERGRITTELILVWALTRKDLHFSPLSSDCFIM